MCFPHRSLIILYSLAVSIKTASHFSSPGTFDTVGYSNQACQHRFSCFNHEQIINRAEFILVAAFTESENLSQRIEDPDRCRIWNPRVAKLVLENVTDIANVGLVELVKGPKVSRSSCLVSLVGKNWGINESTVLNKLLPCYSLNSRNTQTLVKIYYEI